MKPVYKIEVYDATPTLIHTITADAGSVYFKEIVTSGIGHFNFTVPSDDTFEDIAEGNTVKIWMGYDSVSGDPNFVGKVGKIVGQHTLDGGYTRAVSGLSQGEVLKRRLKRVKWWRSSGASTIVTEIATDLSLGTGDIASDTNQETILVDAEDYFDLLRKVSDYWVDADHQVKKDFYVDVDGDLVWKARPIRTAGVETLTAGDNILNYTVVRDVNAVENKIHVYGRRAKYNPSNKDSWTEDTTDGWSCRNAADDPGTPAKSADRKTGDFSINCPVPSGGGASGHTVKKTFSSMDLLVRKGYSTVHWWCKLDVPNALWELHLLANDESNYYCYGDYTGDSPNGDEWLGGSSGGSAWTEHTLDLREVTSTTGSPDIDDVQGILWFCDVGPGVSDTDYRFDQLYFGPARFYALVEDATSQTNYGIREAEYVYETLFTDSECTLRGERLIYQKKTAPIQLAVTTYGNMNILVGDRIPMTLPRENISSANFDVFSVEHALSGDDWRTTANMLNSADTRNPLESTPLEMLINLKQHVRNLGRDERKVS